MLAILYLLHADQGRITRNNVSLLSAAFPSTFTLIGETQGGPPTTFYWSINGDRIKNSSTFTYNIKLNGRFQQLFILSAFVSFLTVTGRHPGIYEYTVSNRAMSGQLVSTMFRVQGMHFAAWGQWRIQSFNIIYLKIATTAA